MWNRLLSVAFLTVMVTWAALILISQHHFVSTNFLSPQQRPLENNELMALLSKKSFIKEQHHHVSPNLQKPNLSKNQGRNISVDVIGRRSSTKTTYATHNNTRTTTSFLYCNSSYAKSQVPWPKTDSIHQLHGRWFRGPKTNYDSKICCGPGLYHDFMKLSPTCVAQGYTKVQSNSCTNYRLFHDDYVWKVQKKMTVDQSKSYISKIEDEYVVPSFNATWVCEQLGTRPVMMIGDSTMQQTFAVLRNSLRHTSCAGEEGNIRWHLSDTLVHRNYGVANRGGQSWYQLLDQRLKELKQSKSKQRMVQHEPMTTARNERDIVILTVGAHIRNSDCDFVEVIDEVLDRLYSKWLPSDDFLFVWKTQNPAGCLDKAYHPDNPLLAGIDFSSAMVTHEYHKQFWNRDEYVLTQIDQRNNDLAQKLLSTTPASSNSIIRNNGKNKVHILDMRMLYSRTDAHPGSPTLNQKVEKPDCLHYFANGPLDVIGPMFQQLLVDTA